jgi:hypothetical protein
MIPKSLDEGRVIYEHIDGGREED